MSQVSTATVCFSALCRRSEAEQTLDRHFAHTLTPLSELFLFLILIHASQRIVRLGGAVDDDGCNLIVAQLLWLDAADPEKV